jgi:hypothetical protein
MVVAGSLGIEMGSQQRRRGRYPSCSTVAVLLVHGRLFQIKARGWARWREQNSNGGEEDGLSEVGGPADGEIPHLGGPVTGGSGQSTRRLLTSSTTATVVASSAPEPRRPGRRAERWGSIGLAGARLDAASCKESGGEASGEAGGGGVLGGRKGERRMGLIRWRLARREGDGLGRFGSRSGRSAWVLCVWGVSRRRLALNLMAGYCALIGNDGN